MDQYKKQLRVEDGYTTSMYISQYFSLILLKCHFFFFLQNTKPSIIRISEVLWIIQSTSCFLAQGEWNNLRNDLEWRIAILPVHISASISVLFYLNITLFFSFFRMQNHLFTSQSLDNTQKYFRSCFFASRRMI